MTFSVPRSRGAFIRVPLFAMATPSTRAKSLWALAYEPPQRIDPRRKTFHVPGVWYDVTVVTLALLLGVGSLW